MFGGPPPALSPAELRAAEEETNATLRSILVGSFLLYLSPFAVDTLKKLF